MPTLSSRRKESCFLGESPWNRRWPSLDEMTPTSRSRKADDTRGLLKDAFSSLPVLLTLWVLLAKTCGPGRPLCEENPASGWGPVQEGTCASVHITVLPVTCHLSFTGIQVLRLRCFFRLVILLGQLFCHLFSKYWVDMGIPDWQQVLVSPLFLQVSAGSRGFAVCQAWSLERPEARRAASMPFPSYTDLSGTSPWVGLSVPQTGSSHSIHWEETGQW